MAEGLRCGALLRATLQNHIVVEVIVGAVRSVDEAILLLLQLEVTELLLVLSEGS